MSTTMQKTPIPVIRSRNPLFTSGKQPGFFLLLLLILSLGSLHCYQEKITYLPLDNGKFEFNKDTYWPTEIATIKVAPGLLKKEIYLLSIGEQEVEAVNLGDTMLVLTMPDHAPAQYTVRADIQRSEFEGTVSIRELPPIDDPTQYVTSFVTETATLLDRLEPVLDSLAAAGVYPQDELQNEFKQLTVAHSEILDQFRQASAAEKQGAARFIEANRQSLEEIQLLLSEITSDGKDLLGARGGPCMNGSQWTQFRCLVRQLIIAIAKASAPVVAGGLIGGELGLAPGAFIGGTLGYLLFKNYIHSQFEVIKCIIGRMTDLALVPADELSAELAYRDDVTFESGVARELDFTFPLRNISQSADRQSPYPAIRSFVEKFDTFTDFWEKYLRKLGFGLPRFAGPRTTYERADKASQLSIRNISNSDVRGSLSQSGNQIMIKFSSQEEERCTLPFSYTIEYNSEGITFSRYQNADLQLQTEVCNSFAFIDHEITVSEVNICPLYDGQGPGTYITTKLITNCPCLDQVTFRLLSRHTDEHGSIFGAYNDTTSSYTKRRDTLILTHCVRFASSDAYVTDYTIRYLDDNRLGATRNVRVNRPEGANYEGGEPQISTEWREPGEEPVHHHRKMGGGPLLKSQPPGSQ